MLATRFFVARHIDKAEHFAASLRLSGPAAFPYEAAPVEHDQRPVYCAKMVRNENRIV